MNQMIASADRLQRLDSGLNFVERQSQRQTHGCTCQRVIDHVVARNRNQRGKTARFCHEVAAAAAQSQIFHMLRIEIQRRIQPKEGRLWRPGLQGNQLVVVAVYNNLSAGHGLFKHLSFGLQNAVPGFQILQMAETDIGQHADRGLCHAGKPGHLPEVADSHLQDSRLVLLADTENGQGQADFVVEIAFGFQYVKMLSQNGGNHFLGTGLAHAAGDSHHRYGQGTAVIGGKIFQGLQCGSYLDIRSGRMLRRVLTEYTGSALGEDGRDKAVAVHTLALNGGKEKARLHLPAVDDNACDFDGF